MGWVSRWWLAVLAVGMLGVALVVQSQRLLLAGVAMLTWWAVGRLLTILDTRRSHQTMAACRSDHG
jgi:hypothetical protein